LRRGDIKGPRAARLAQNEKGAAVISAAPRMAGRSTGYLLNVFAIIPWTSAEALTIRAMLAEW
jgi:hypothetical protein